MRIRDEELRDHAAVRALLLVAFPTPAEADLVEVLRREARPLLSLVAEVDGAPAGHILFTPVELAGHPERWLMGLAPLAVAPHVQRLGIGAALVRAGLERCRALGAGAVVVLGHPDYYPRMGFAPAARWGIRCEYDVPPEAFMLVELQPGHLQGASGLARYPAAFARL